MSSLQKLKDLAVAAIDERASALGNLSTEIWKKPELAFEETFAHKILTEFLEKEGFSVKRQTPLKTSFIARSESRSGPLIGIMCEYDALPGLGHACGHNLIAEAGVAAAIGLKTALAADPTLEGQVVVLGTPAEESGGGKVDMLQKGAFDDLDLCMMVHPSPMDTDFEDPHIISASGLDIIYTGKAAHAAAAPWEGVNALDAAVTCYTSIALMKKQTKPDSNIHGIITNGGDKANIIPSKASLKYIIRAPTDAETFALVDKIKLCAQGAAEASGCTVEFQTNDRHYSNLHTNRTLRELYRKNLLAIGYQQRIAYDPNVRASTDAGNVSYVKPTIHPMFAINSLSFNHTKEFADASGNPEAQSPTLFAAKAMALASIDVLCNPSLLKEIKDDFEKEKGTR